MLSFLFFHFLLLFNNTKQVIFIINNINMLLVLVSWHNLYDISVMLLERRIRDISRVLVLARNSVYSARSVKDAIPHVYKMEGHRSFHENPLILSS